MRQRMATVFEFYICKLFLFYEDVLKFATEITEVYFTISDTCFFFLTTQIVLSSEVQNVF